ncbi:hypothetical protein FOL46_007844 [Perkinsus olseni]|uniref:Uncharacterized protein n=1 Tax=Perkinsus olseni TaxID=32597 RepID=A0A7J6LAX3_PEROL|nr:hypothetical protein FOL46_007844 [Perkinsus olseni]
MPFLGWESAEEKRVREEADRKGKNGPVIRIRSPPSLRSPAERSGEGLFRGLTAGMCLGLVTASSVACARRVDGRFSVGRGMLHVAKCSGLGGLWMFLMFYSRYSLMDDTHMNAIPACLLGGAFAGSTTSFLYRPRLTGTQVNKTADLIAAVSANLATDRSTWRAGKTPSSGFKDEAADAREKAGTAIDDLGALLKEQGRRLKGSSPAFYRSVKEILAGRLKALDDEARQWQMYKHRVSSEREQRYEVDPVALEKEAARLQELRRSKAEQDGQGKPIDVLPNTSFDDQSSLTSERPGDAGLEMESQMLLATYTNELDHARTTQHKVEELSHVVGVMGTKVDEQMEQIGGVIVLVCLFSLLERGDFFVLEI